MGINELDNVMKDIQKTYKKKNDTIIYDPDREKIPLSSGSAVIDSQHNGGLCYLGRITQLMSLESGGKTTLALQTAILACKNYPDKGVVFFDMEQHMDYTYLEMLSRKYGFDSVPSNLYILQPMNAEELEDVWLKFMAKNGDKIVLAIIDSVAATKPKSMLEKIHGESSQKSQHAMFWNDFIPKVNNDASKFQLAVLLVNQLRAAPSLSNMDKFKTGGQVGLGAGASNFDTDMTPTGGNALRYYISCSYMLSWSGRVKEQLENDQTGEIEDVEVSNKYTIRNVKNKVARPYSKSKYIIRFGDGTDDAPIILERMKEIGRITNQGSFLSYHARNSDLDFRVNGKVKFNEKFMMPDILADATIQYIDSYKSDFEMPELDDDDNDDMDGLLEEVEV